MRYVPMEDRFWAMVEKADGDGCWTFLGWKDVNGYGRITKERESRKMLAHRYSYLLHYGEFDQSLMIRHMCHNPSCVRPDHLRTGDQIQNMRDRREAGRARNWSMDVTHCPKGHPYDEENTHYGTKGERKCRECNRERSRAAHKRRYAADPEAVRVRNRERMRAWRAKKSA